MEHSIMSKKLFIPEKSEDQYQEEGVELEDVTDDWYDEEGNLIP
tara:strand:+ start:100 stop:231 length:132 start_codon:yes stop_codon:yes gene_type:complete